MTERLYYEDCYLSQFRARVVEASADRRCIYLDRTAFYPNSGGQPSDGGTLGGAAIIDVVDEGERVAHLTGGPVADEVVEGRVDWGLRFDHMQQHSGQHLLSAVLVEALGIPTISFHLGQESSTIDVAVAALDSGQIAQIERRANAVVFENRPVTISFVEAGAAADLRKPSERQGILRVVSIADLDRSACGGTHVRATGEIGAVLIRKLEKIRGSVRIEFLCGSRAVEHARADYDALARISRSLSAQPGETPALVEAQIEKLQESEKARRKLAVELAQSRGRELHEATAAGAGGLRRAVRTLASGVLDDALRAEAQAFAARGGAVFVVAIESPPAILLACSADSGVAAGATLQPLVAALGGRGGGNAAMAQGSLPSVEAVREAVRKLSH